MLIFMIIVVGIIVLAMNSVESSKKQSKLSAIREKDRRITNARLERETVDKYVKYGLSFDEAFERAREDIIASGFDPCIPKGEYKVNKYGERNSPTHYSTHICGRWPYDVSKQFDSFAVKQRRNSIKQQWRNVHGDEIPSDELERRIYEAFPQTEFDYLRDLDAQIRVYKTIEIGSYITYPGLGMCEIIGYNNPELSWGTYQLKVLKTGEVVNYVRIGDNRIQRQG